MIGLLEIITRIEPLCDRGSSDPIQKSIMQGK